jgi:hypothetical protein
VTSKSPPSEIHQCHSHQRDGVTKADKLCPFKAKIVQLKGQVGKFVVQFQVGVEHASEAKGKARRIDPMYIDQCTLPSGYSWSENNGATFVVSSRAVIGNVLSDYNANGQTGDVGLKADGTFGQQRS